MRARRDTFGRLRRRLAGHGWLAYVLAAIVVVLLVGNGTLFYLIGVGVPAVVVLVGFVGLLGLVALVLGMAMDDEA